MGIRTGEQYLRDLDASPRDLWIDGEQVVGRITEHPDFRNVTRSVAALYDMQHVPELQGMLTYRSPSTGDLVGLSFMQPHTREDLTRRRQMMMQWARYSHGMMGRAPTI